MVKLIDGHEIFDTLWELYLEAFPPAERRSKNHLIELMKKDNFFFNGIVYEEKQVGLVGYWVFEDFIYLEYLAINASSRGSGAGGKFIQFFKDKFKGEKIILEVEHPIEDIQKRRVGFYERYGFHFNDASFVQPQINENTSHEIILNIMSSPLMLTKAEYEKVKSTLFEKVYK